MSNIEVKKQNQINNYKPDYITPAVDIIETDKDVRCIFDMPGVEKNKINVNYDKDVLTVEAEATNYISEKWTVISAEYKPANYRRSISFSDIIDASKITAEYENGVLTVSLAKKEKARPKTIEVSVK